MRCVAVAIVPVLTLAACGGSETPTAESPASVSSPEPAAEGDPTRAPLSAADLVDRDADVFVYVNASAFRDGAIYRQVMKLVESFPEGRHALKELEGKCGLDPLEAPNELAFSMQLRGGDPDPSTAVLALRTDVAHTAAFDCLVALVPQSTRTQVDGRPALSLPLGHVVAGDTFLIGGAPTPLARAIGREQAGKSGPQLTDVLFASIKVENPLGSERIVLAIGPSNGQTQIRVEAGGLSPQASARAEALARDLKRRAMEETQTSTMTPDQRRASAALIERIDIQRRGTDVVALLDLGTGEAGAATSSMLIALSVYNIRRYVQGAKMQEARFTTARIAKLMSIHASEQTPSQFPPSAPRVPAEVPSGYKYQSVPAEWSHPSWQAIGFSIQQPQYYAYEYETSKDRRRATVRATGDLDGDGVQSRCELKLAIQRGEVVIEPNLIETNPRE